MCFIDLRIFVALPNWFILTFQQIDKVIPLKKGIFASIKPSQTIRQLP